MASQAMLGRSFDPEGLVIDPRTGNFLVADEYGPSLYAFDRKGRLVQGLRDAGQPRSRVWLEA